MAKFNIDKKGYNTQEVDDYITNLYLKYEEKLSEQKDRVVALKNEVDNLNEKLSGFLHKDEQISKALIFAVEKSEQIENNAKTIYNLEIKRINALYSRWEELLLEIEDKCPEINKNRYINTLMEEFKNSIEEISDKSLTLNSKGIKDELKKSSDDFIKNILNRMDYIVNSRTLEVAQVKSKTVSEPKSAAQPTKITEKEQIIPSEKKPNARMNLINERLKKITHAKPNAKGESMADKYLNSNDDIAINAYAKNFAKRKLEKTGDVFAYAEYPAPNESGFDLKEALNPKENLDEIMKSFDFFDDEE